MRTFGICLGITLAAVAIGCGSADSGPAPSLKLTGTVDTATMKLDNAKAVARAADGHVYSAYLDRSGHFALNLPTGSAYRIVIANTTRTGALKTLGHLVNGTSHGLSHRISAHTTGVVRLGTVSPTQTVEELGIGSQDIIT